MKCEKHNCSFVFEDIGHGKSKEVCPVCEKEEHMKRVEHYKEMGIKSICPLCEQEVKNENK